jgi:predicted DNA-binding antitoxin AbrB/MazE fold protein
MNTMTAIVRNGQIELPRPIDLPDGTEVEIRLPEAQGADSGHVDEGPLTPEEIARTLAAMEKVEPLEMSEEERAALDADRQARKEWEKAHFDSRAEELRRIWQ